NSPQSRIRVERDRGRLIRTDAAAKVDKLRARLRRPNARGRNAQRVGHRVGKGPLTPRRFWQGRQNQAQRKYPVTRYPIHRAWTIRRKTSLSHRKTAWF